MAYQMEGCVCRRGDPWGINITLERKVISNIDSSASILQNMKYKLCPNAADG